jgi:hypothetical protein
MTHDELLAKLDELDHSCSVVGVTIAALRAVVELHWVEPDWMNQCEVCYKKVDFREFVNEPYPCPTIQAIEKELL